MSAIRRACEIVGGVTAMANELGIKPPSVSEWIANNKVPPRRVLDIEKAVNKEVTRHELAPELYPLEETKQSA